jgi:hypothetical protein
VHWIDKKRRAGKGRRPDAAVAGLLPAGVSAEHLGPFDYFYWDDFWGVAGLRAGAEVLRAVDRPDVAAEADRFASAMWADLERSLALTAERLGTDAVPAGPRRRIDPGAIGSLVACAPLDLLPSGDTRIVATADLIRSRFMLEDGRAFYQGISHTGLGTYLTLQLAAVELRDGDRRCLDRLAWMLDAATPTWTWPQAVGASCTSQPWPYQPVGTSEASATPPSTSRTSRSRTNVSSSAAAHPWCPSPMHPPSIRGWIASGQVQVGVATLSSHSSRSRHRRSPARSSTAASCMVR